MGSWKVHYKKFDKKVFSFGVVAIWHRTIWQPYIIHLYNTSNRKANEGVRISHLDLETRMNSRDEFRQGTNIMIRGVGVKDLAETTTGELGGGGGRHFFFINIY